MSTGVYSTCAVTDTGAAKCWGDGALGQMANNTSGEGARNNAQPVLIAGREAGVQAISSGRHVCAVTNGGAVKCWGENAQGQLGNNSMVDSLAPVDVVGLGGAVAVVVADSTSYALAGGAVTCWGYNGAGQLGNNSTVDSAVPIDVAGLSSVVAITAAASHACALTSVGKVKCWGYGMLGLDAPTSRGDFSSLVPAEVKGLDSVIGLSTGPTHSCAILQGGGLKCWGQNEHLQIGVPYDVNHPAVIWPVDVPGVSQVVAVSVGTTHTCAIIAGGVLKCWGGNNMGQVGNGTMPSTVSSPTQIHLSAGAISISAGFEHTCALLSGGGAACWGGNADGAAGTGDLLTFNYPVPVAVTGF